MDTIGTNQTGINYIPCDKLKHRMSYSEANIMEVLLSQILAAWFEGFV